MKNPLKKKSSPDEQRGDDKPIVSEFSPMPSVSSHYHEAQHHPGVELTLDKLDEPTMHSAFRAAINQWILSNEGWQAEFPGPQTPSLVPLLKSIAYHRHGIKMLMGVLYKGDATEVYNEWLEENEDKDSFEDMETDAVMKYGELVDMHDLGFRKGYKGKRDDLAAQIRESGQDLKIEDEEPDEAESQD